MRFCRVAIILLAFTILTGNAIAQEKPGFNEKDLEKYTYYFDFVDGKLTGDGAAFLTNEIRQSQFVLIGEYHGSPRISEFTSAVIPVFHDAGCRNFALEIGPISAEILAELSKRPEETTANLNAFNTRFLVNEGKRSYTAIPFMDSVEDAAFLTEAARRKWNLFGLDQEFSFSYIPLTERMYRNLGRKKQAALKQLFETVISRLKVIYERDAAANGEPAAVAIFETKEINQFLDSASAGNEKNKLIAEAFRKTVAIYRNNALRKYYEANSTRVEYMKRNLAEGFTRVGFDQRRDRLLLKMGGVHTGRGFSPLSLFEIGNTLSELAAVNGNRSLHIDFGTRYYLEDGKEIDALDNKSGFLYRFRDLTQMARKDKWTVIDLRPLRESVFYWRKYKLDDVVLEIVKNHDFMIVPKLDGSSTPNYKR